VVSQWKRKAARAIADLEERPRVIRCALEVYQTDILVELNAEVRELHIHGVNGESAAHHEFFARMPGESDTWLEIVIVAGIQAVRRVDARALPYGHGIRAVRIEVAHQPVLCGERTLVRIPDPEVRRNRRRDLPVILKVETVNGRARQPRRQFRIKLR